MAYIYFDRDEDPVCVKEDLIYLAERSRVEQFILVTLCKGGRKLLINRDHVIYFGDRV